MDKSPEAFRTITEVSKWLDTPAHVLRFWESRFPEVSPVKRAGGRRYYRPEDMRILGGIKTMLHDKGQSIKDVQDLLSSDGAAAIAEQSPDLDFNDTAAQTNDDAAAPSRLTLFGDTAPSAAVIDTSPEAEPTSPSPEQIAGDADTDGTTPDPIAPASDPQAPEPAPTPPRPTVGAHAPFASPRHRPGPHGTPSTGGFQSRRQQRPVGDDPAPESIRGFFFNDMSEPALPPVDDAPDHDLDRDDPANYPSFTATPRPVAPTEAPQESPEATPKPAAPVQPPRRTLPRDPEDPSLDRPGLPTLAAELRTHAPRDRHAPIPAVALAALAGRLRDLRTRFEND